MQTTPMKVVIIDDEDHSVQFTTKLIETCFPEIEIVGTANNALQGLKVINTEKPDLVFLDIQMPMGSGFDLIDGLGDFKPEIIFITASTDFAIQAIKCSALDYLLKPVDIDQFKETVEKAQEKIIAKIAPDFDVLQANLRNNQPKIIAIASCEGIEYITIEDIIRLEASGSYCEIFLDKKKSIMTSKTLKELEENLAENNFFRTHNSHVINMDKVKKYAKAEGGYILMNDDSQVAISRRKKDLFMDKMMEILN